MLIIPYLEQKDCKEKLDEEIKRGIDFQIYTDFNDTRGIVNVKDIQLIELENKILEMARVLNKTPRAFLELADSVNGDIYKAAIDAFEYKKGYKKG